MKGDRIRYGKYGFSLIEMLVVIAILGILVSIILVSLSSAKGKAKDIRRKAEISQIGKFLILSCYLPDGGEGEYDLVVLADEIISKNPQYGKFLSNIPKDPKTGTETESKYIYTVDVGGQNCAIYANLEGKGEAITLPIAIPTPGGGTGVFEADSPGWNGSKLYFQYSN